MNPQPDHRTDAAAPADPQLAALASEVQALKVELRRQTESATENAKLFAQAHARLRELTAINKVSQAIISTLDVHEILEKSLQQTVQVTNADQGSIMLTEHNADRLRIVASYGLSPEVVEETSVRLGEAISGYVAQSRKPLLVTDARNDQRFRGFTPRDEIRSAMSVPVVTRYEVVGVMNVSRKEMSRPFSTQDLQLLTTLAGQIALAVENARLFEAVSRRNEELSLLMDLGHQLNLTLNMREVLDITVDEACMILRPDACAVFLLDDRNDVLRIRAARNLARVFHRKVRGILGHGLLGDVALTGTPAYVEDIALATRLEYRDLHDQERLRSLLCAPLRVGGLSLGVLTVYTREMRHWDDHEMNMLMALCGQASMALHNAQNYQYQRGIAELVQRNLVPHIEVGGIRLDIGHRYLPAKQVGGDYYDVFQIDGNRIGILMADVAGKSVQAAVHTAKGKYFIRALGYDARSPAEVMSRTNTLIQADTTIEAFISAFYAVMDPRSRTLWYCNAGHPPPLIVKADGRIVDLHQPDILLGILSDARYHAHMQTLESGDAVILCTDGVTDARNDLGFFGQEGLRSCLITHRGSGAQAVANAIVHDVLQHAGQRHRDDIAVLVIRVP